jgi:hypothetical protein
VNQLRKYISEMSETDRLKCIIDYIVFEKQGFIDGCVLREITRDFLTKSGMDGTGTFVIFMDRIVGEIYRYYAMKSFAITADGELQIFNEGDTEKSIKRFSVTSTEPDLSKCPRCGGPADNGHDRCVPPNPYNCSKCEKEEV